MELFVIAEQYLTMIFISALIVLVSAGGGLYYFIRIKKVTGTTEKIDYSTFRRVDAKEFVKFDDIIYEGDDVKTAPGMLALGNNVFVAGLNIQGFDFFNASEDEQISTMLHSIALTRIIRTPITLRQSVKATDLSGNIAEYESIVKRLEIELMDLDHAYQDAVVAMEDIANEEDSEEEVGLYKNFLKDIQFQIFAKKHQQQEAQELIGYMQAMVAAGSRKKQRDVSKSAQILFDYVFDPASVTEELSADEILLKALSELETKASGYKNALAACGCSCSRLTSNEIIMLMRKHMAPLTSAEMTMDDLINSSYKALYVDSSSLLEKVKSKMDEESFERELAAYRESMGRVLAEQERERLEYEKTLMDKVNSVAMSASERQV